MARAGRREENETLKARHRRAGKPSFGVFPPVGARDRRQHEDGWLIRALTRMGKVKAAICRLLHFKSQQAWDAWLTSQPAPIKRSVVENWLRSHPALPAFQKAGSD